MFRFLNETHFKEDGSFWIFLYIWHKKKTNFPQNTVSMYFEVFWVNKHQFFALMNKKATKKVLNFHQKIDDEVLSQ